MEGHGGVEEVVAGFEEGPLSMMQLTWRAGFGVGLGSFLVRNLAVRGT